MNASEYFDLLRRQWKVVAAAVLIGLLVAVAITMTMPRRYSASIDFYIGAQAGADPSSAYQAGLFAAQRVKSYTELMTTDRVGQDVSALLGGEVSPEQVISGLSASAKPETVLINVRVEGASPTLSLLTAQALVRVFPRVVDDLERSNGQVGPSAISARVVHDPVVGQAPTSPDILLNIGLGLLAGLAVGLGIALALRSLDATVRTTNEIEQLSGRSVLASIQSEAGARRGRRAVADDESTTAEDYRRLRTALKHVASDHLQAVVAFVSPRSADGRSSTVRNLAIAEGRVGRKVAVVDADLRHAESTVPFGVEGDTGLSDVLVRRIDVDDVLRSTDEPNVWVVPAGKPSCKPIDLLDSTLFRQTIDRLRRQFDIVLIDTPPMMAYGDATVVAEQSDKIVLVCRYGATLRCDIRDSVSMLASVAKNVSGSVLTMVPARPGGPLHSSSELATSTTVAARSAPESALIPHQLRSSDPGVDAATTRLVRTSERPSPYSRSI